MTVYAQTFNKLRDAAQSFGANGRALVDALNAWEAHSRPAGYDDVGAELLLLNLKNRRKARQLDKSAKALRDAMGKTP